MINHIAILVGLFATTTTTHSVDADTRSFLRRRRPPLDVQQQLMMNRRELDEGSMSMSLPLSLSELELDLLPSDEIDDGFMSMSMPSTSDVGNDSNDILNLQLTSLTSAPTTPPSTDDLSTTTSSPTLKSTSDELLISSESPTMNNPSLSPSKKPTMIPTVSPTPLVCYFGYIFDILLIYTIHYHK